MPGTLGTGTLGSGTLGEPAEVVAPARVAIVREYPPDDLAWRIDPPNGRPSRWAADEPLTENVASDMRLVDEMPGLDKEGSVLLARNPRESFPDLAPFSAITVYGPGVEEVANYRLDKTPESDGDRVSITAEAVGWSKALEDNSALIGPGFIDGDLSKCGEPSAALKAALIGAGADLSGISTSIDAAAGEVRPSLTFSYNHLKAGKVEWNEFVYDSGGVDIAEVLYDFLGRSASPDASFLHRASLSADGIVETVTGTDHNASTALQQVVSSAVAGLRFVRFISAYLGAAEGDPYAERFRLQNLKVIGRHGLALQGTWPDVGFTVAPMLGWAIPEFTELEARDEDLEDTGYIVQQAWFSDPGPMSQVVQELTKYELLDWFVEKKRFKLKRPGTYGRRWQAYAGPSGLQEQGFDAARSWDRILVTAQDVDGRTLSVGPIGSGATVETDALEITDPDHPAVRAGVDRMDRLDLRRISTPARMIEVGEIWLREANRLNRSGSATLSGYVMDDRGVMRPVSQVRAGDEVRFPDAADPSYRRIVRRSYEHNTRTATVDLDAPPEGLQALLERLQADIQTLALS